jgi:hypothetical protein
MRSGGHGSSAVLHSFNNVLIACAAANIAFKQFTHF